MMLITNRFILLFVFSVVLVQGNTAESLTLHDAAFSPGGETIGVGTDEGFQLLDKEGQRVLYSYPVPEGVRFMKWAPDGRRVLLSSWKDGNVPDYVILDPEQNKIVSTFQEEARWYFAHYFGLENDEYEFTNRLEEDIHPESIRLGHPANAAFSSNGRELAFITLAGDIVIRNADTGAIVHTFSFPGHHFFSVGYRLDGQKIWLGEYTWNKEVGEDSFYYEMSPLTGQLSQSQKIDTSTLGGNHPALIYEIAQSGKYALALSPYMYSGSPDPMLFGSIYLVNLETGKVDSTFLSQGDFLLFKNRARFGDQDRVFGIIDYPGYILYQYIVYDYHSKIQRDLYLRGLPDPIPLSQPFSPDGRELLQIEEGLLFIVNCETGSYEQIDLQSAGVKNSSLHETGREK